MLGYEFICQVVTMDENRVKSFTKLLPSICWRIYTILHVVLLTNTNNCGSTYCLQTLNSLKSGVDKKKNKTKKLVREPRCYMLTLVHLENFL